VKCSSKRHLRPDPNFDGIISAIYPNLEEYEAKEETMIAEINKNLMKSRSLLDGIEQGKKRQALAKATRVKPKKPSQSKAVETKAVKRKETKDDQREKKKPRSHKKLDKNKESTSEAKSKVPLPVQPQQNQNEIGFVLLIHPNETGLKQIPNKYLRTSKLLTVRHLCKFLAKKFEMDPKLFKIGVYPKASPLQEEITLAIIEKELWNAPGELTLYYKLATTV